MKSCLSQCAIQTLVHEGGIVPKSLYKSLSDEEGHSPVHDGNHIYQSIDLKPGQIHEVIIKNNDPSSVLTWDFDVIRSTLKFSVFRTCKTLPKSTGMPFAISTHSILF